MVATCFLDKTVPVSSNFQKRCVKLPDILHLFLGKVISRVSLSFKLLKIHSQNSCLELRPFAIFNGKHKPCKGKHSDLSLKLQTQCYDKPVCWLSLLKKLERFPSHLLHFRPLPFFFSLIFQHLVCQYCLKFATVSEVTSLTV